MGVLYQLYECAVGFADKEEERRAKILDTYEKQKTSNKFNISQMKKYKQIDDYYITDAIVLKNNYLVLSSCEDEYNPRLRIYDEFYENELHVIELIEGINKNSKQYQYKIKKLVLYNISITSDFISKSWGFLLSNSFDFFRIYKCWAYQFSPSWLNLSQKINLDNTVANSALVT